MSHKNILFQKLQHQISGMFQLTVQLKFGRKLGCGTMRHNPPHIRELLPIREKFGPCLKKIHSLHILLNPYILRVQPDLKHFGAFLLHHHMRLLLNIYIKIAKIGSVFFFMVN